MPQLPILIQSIDQAPDWEWVCGMRFCEQPPIPVQSWDMPTRELSKCPTCGAMMAKRRIQHPHPEAR